MVDQSAAPKNFVLFSFINEMYQITRLELDATAYCNGVPETERLPGEVGVRHMQRRRVGTIYMLNNQNDLLLLNAILVTETLVFAASNNLRR